MQVIFLAFSCSRNKMSVRDWLGKGMGRVFSKSKRRSSKSKQRGNPYEVSGEEGMASTPSHFVQHSQMAHTDAVTCVAPVASGLALSGSKDQTVVLYDFSSGCIKQKWTHHQKEVTKVVYGERSDAFFSSSRDKTACLFRHSQSPVTVFSGHELVVTALDLNGDNSRLVTGSRDNSVRLWDVQTGECLLISQISRNLVTHVCWSKTGDLMAQSGEDKEVRIFDARDLRVVRTFPRKQYIQTWCDISECGNYCLTSSNGFQGNGCEATLWDIRTSSIVHEYKGHFESCCCAKFIPSHLTGGKNLIMTSSNDCTVRVWDRESRDCLCTQDIPVSGPLTSLALFEDGKVCVSSFNVGVQVLQMAAQQPGDIHLQRISAF